ncbi:MAG: type II restriction endonuclease [Candidatus Woesearchaeota archaeon]
MKYIEFYKKNNISEQDVFNYFINNMRSSIKVWDYFVNWNKVNNNLSKIDVELNILNSLIGKDNFDNAFKELLTKYPSIIKALPILLAVRDNKLEILKDYKKGDLTYLEFDFTEKTNLTEQEITKYLEYMTKSGLKELFLNKKVKNFVDYVLGVEVGLDSNGRKNRGGKLMEEIVEVFVKKTINENPHLEYISQATPTRIKKLWNFNINFEKSARSYDFAIYNKETKKIFLIETNFYNGGGSKLKSVCGEFKSLFNELKKQNIELIWITDGKGWESAKRPLEETFNNNNYVFNLDAIDKNILKEILLKNVKREKLK